MALRVAMTHGEFISVGLGVGDKNWRIGVQQLCDFGTKTLRVEGNYGMDKENKKITLGCDLPGTEIKIE
jgi:hypothetical protein